MEKVNKNCVTCGHLCILNKNKVYAVCDEFAYVFKLWKQDAKVTGCSYWIPREEKN